MTARLSDRVKETSTTTGTGSLTLDGAVANFRTFTSEYATTTEFFSYAIVNTANSQWEVGIGNLTGTTTLARVAVIRSSNANALVSLTAGTHDVFVTAAGGDLNGLILSIFGDGDDGDLSISSGTTTLTRDMYYRNLTISSTAILNPASYRVFVSGVLDMSSLSAGAGIVRTPTAGNAGATAGTAGTAVTALTAGSLSVGQGGTGAGGAGGTAAGTQAGNPTAFALGDGGEGGDGGAGGAGSGGAGGVKRANNAITAVFPIRNINQHQIRLTTAIGGGAQGAGGSGGGGDGTSGGGGASSGLGGNIFFIAARVIFRDTGSIVGSIRATGGAGANGGSAVAGNRGGGGGSGGSGGGWITLIYEALKGTAVTNFLTAFGGLGGTGGAGFGTGIGGNGGDGGNGGRIQVFDLGTGTFTETDGTQTAGTAGSAGSGVTGGAGGAGTTTQVTL